MEENHLEKMYLKELSSFFEFIKSSKLKREISEELIYRLKTILKPKFVSFITKENNFLRVLCQSGEKESVKDIQEIFNEEFSKQIFSFVNLQGDIFSIDIEGKGKFLFVPLILDKEHKYGMLLLHFSKTTVDELEKLVLKTFCSIAVSGIYRIESNNNVNYEKSSSGFENILLGIHKAMNPKSISNKLLFEVIESQPYLNGNVWLVDEVTKGISLVFMAQVISPSTVASALLSGYLIGLVNEIKNKLDISLNPVEFLKQLNFKINQIYKNTGVTVNAWYGVFNLDARKVNFSNANYTEPFLIGLEQQISKLANSENFIGQPLGVSLNAQYIESSCFIPYGSKIIICTKNLVDDSSKVDTKYDSTWLPQILETVSTLSLSEMKSSLENLLSEDNAGTALKPSRLALLLEIPNS